MKYYKFRKITFISFLLLITVSLILYFSLAESFSLTSVRLWLAGFGIWAPIIFIALYTLGTIFIPSTPFMAAAGILFGFKYGFLYTLIGGFLSSIIVFSLSRNLGKDWVESIFYKKQMSLLHKYNTRLESGGFWDLILLRIAPVIPFNVLNITMGISKIKTSVYILGTLIGLLPSNILAVYFGANILTIIKIF